MTNSTQNCTCIESGYAQTTNHCPVHKNSTQNERIDGMMLEVQDINMKLNIGLGLAIFIGYYVTFVLGYIIGAFFGIVYK